MIESRRIYLDKDTRLMIKASKGNRDAYDRLYSKYFSAVVNFTASLNGQLQSPEDVAQEVFYRIWKKRKEYRPTAAFKTYLFGCARIVLLEQLRALKKDLAAHRMGFLKLSTSSSTILSQSKCGIDITEIISRVQKAKSQLTAKQSQAVELFHGMHISVNKAARLTGCTEKALECRLARARKKLRQILVSQEAEKV